MRCNVRTGEEIAIVGAGWGDADTDWKIYGLFTLTGGQMENEMAIGAAATDTERGRMTVNPSERTLVEQSRVIEKLCARRAKKVEEIDELDAEIKAERNRLRGMLPLLESAGATA